MFIALEGCDGVGKSTFAKELHSALEERGLTVEVLHRGVPERDVLDEYQHDIEDYHPGQGRAIIADRWHLGDIVYGELYRGFSYLGGLSGAGFRFVELFLQSRGAVTVLIDGESSVIKQRLTSRGEDYLKMEHVDHVLSRYRDVFQESPTGVLQTASPDVETVLKHASFWSATAQDLAPYASYVGPRSPRVLLVGERRGKEETPSLCAFRPTTAGNSAEFLLQSLPGSLWRDAGMVNAYEEEDLCGLIEVLAGPPVIALGRKASIRLNKLKVEHAGLPHPAFMRRFHSGASVDYGQKLFNSIGTTAKEFSWPK